MLWDYFARTLGEADERRRRKMAALHSAGELANLRTHVRRKLLEGIGPFPDRTPLNARQTGVIKHPDYTIEKVIFESRPQFYVTANVYRPNSGSGRRPAVIESCGHYGEGKAAPDYQSACIGLARKGFVALIYDPLGQGERMMYRESWEKAEGARRLNEHVTAGNPCFLTGRTLAHYRMWDAMRALDYLETRPDVDKTRMGMLGHSGGGMMTLLTAPLEDRLRAVMSCCAVTSFYHKFLAFLPGDPEQQVPNVYSEGIDHPELIAAVAPRAFLIGVALRDYVPLDGARRTYEETRKAFEIAGVPDNLGKAETDNEHKLDKNLREACYGWMLKHLAGESSDAREPEIQVESEANLRCTPQGRVMELPGAVGVFDMNREYGRRLQASRAKGNAADLRRWLRLPSDLPKAHRSGGDGSEFAIVSEPGIELPATLSGAGKKGALIILASGHGRKSAGAQALARELSGSGYAVLGVDLRGWGETEPRSAARNKKPLGEEFFGVHGIELGRSLLAMRVLDLLAVVSLQRAAYPKIYVVGQGAAGLVALHAAMLEPAIAGVATFQTLRSFEDVLEQRIETEPLASFVPNALEHYDLPELTSWIAPRPCVHVAPFDGASHPIEAAPAPDAAGRMILDGLHL
jgi:cephalosporin-C deacetylase-like acetyl esterase